MSPCHQRSSIVVGVLILTQVIVCIVIIADNGPLHIRTDFHRSDVQMSSEPQDFESVQQMGPKTTITAHGTLQASLESDRTDTYHSDIQLSSEPQDPESVRQMGSKSAITAHGTLQATSEPDSTQDNPGLNSVESVPMPTLSDSGYLRHSLQAIPKNESNNSIPNDKPVFTSQVDSNRNTPNIVFIMADDLGYGDVHYNGGQADTPNLDDMAAGPNSIQFTRFYSGGPVCSPTRGTVLTGRNHNRYCIWKANAGHNCDDFMCSVRLPLPKYEITVAEVLKKHGYRTAIFGKWHVGNLGQAKRRLPKWRSWPISHPGMHGFDKWWVTERSVSTANSNCGCFNVSKCELGHYGSPPSCTNYHTMAKSTLEAYPKPIEGDDSHFLLEQFIKFFHETLKSRRPFFIYLPFHTPHERYVATPEYRQRYLSRISNISVNQADYYGAITAMDEVVGYIRQLLKQYNVSDNTMVWFTSDNGPQAHTPGETAGLRGLKQSLYEGGIRVPGIIEWPSVIKANRKSDIPVVTSDFFPTVCDILGVDLPKDRPIDGISILPLIRGEISSRDRSIAWAYKISNGDFKGNYTAAITGNQYKLYADYSKGKICKAQLFDLLNDQGEERDISGEHMSITISMAVELEKWRQSVINSARTEAKCIG